MVAPVFAEIKPDVYQSIEDLDTPVILVDLDVLERNLQDFADFADANDLSVRSHVKAHKIPELARRQEELFGPGVLCQTLGEAEVMAQQGVSDILLVCPVVRRRKLERLLWVAEKVDEFAMMVDCPGNVDPLQELAAEHETTVDVVLEVDVGMDRMGVQPGEPAVELAAYIADQPNLELTGILGHDGQLRIQAETREDYERLAERVASELSETVEALAAAGIEVEDVISGATAPAKFTGKHDVVTELDPGRYVFNDVGLFQSRLDVGIESCAATVLTTVISRPTEDRAIVDAGSKTLSYSSKPMPVPVNRDDVEFYKKSSEHGFVDVSEATDPVEVGDRLEFVIPNLYGAVNIHDTFVCVRDGRVEDVFHVAARGMDK